MHSFDLRIDVSGKTGLPDELSTAVTVHLPDDLRSPTIAMFGFPGGGFGRHYYDVRSLPEYSQAEYHTRNGNVFVACDHLHVGESSHPDTFSLTYENLAAANHTTSEFVLRGLRQGTLAPGVGPIAVEKTIAMGQSMGGCLLTVQQARHRSFDGVAFLGWSGIYTNFPSRTVDASPIRCPSAAPTCGPSPIRCSASSHPTRSNSGTASTGPTRNHS